MVFICAYIPSLSLTSLYIIIVRALVHIFIQELRLLPSRGSSILPGPCNLTSRQGPRGREWRTTERVLLEALWKWHTWLPHFMSWLELSYIVPSNFRGWKMKSNWISIKKGKVTWWTYSTANSWEISVSHPDRSLEQVWSLCFKSNIRMKTHTHTKKIQVDTLWTLR